MSTNVSIPVFPGILACLIAAAFFIGGCSGLALSADERGVYQETLGTGTPNDIVTQAPALLRSRYNLEIYRVENDFASNDVYIQTVWAEQTPASDEVPQITSVRTRLIIEGRPRARSGPRAGQTSVIQFKAEKQVLRMDQEGWTTAAFTASEQEYLEEIVDRLKAEVVTGIRTY